MNWDKTENYIALKEASEFLKSTLGLSQLDLDTRDALLPYQVVITQYLNKRLILLGTDNIKELVTEIFKIYDEGADLICDKKLEELLNTLEIPQDDPHYFRDHFVFSWANYLSTLCLRLKFQYSHLFKQEYDGECCKCCKPGQTTTDFESWTSGVYPNDEEYDRTNYTRTNSAWQTSKDRYCECYRHNTDNNE